MILLSWKWHAFFMHCFSWNWSETWTYDITTGTGFLISLVVKLISKIGLLWGKSLLFSHLRKKEQKQFITLVLAIVFKNGMCHYCPLHPHYWPHLRKLDFASNWSFRYWQSTKSSYLLCGRIWCVLDSPGQMMLSLYIKKFKSQVLMALYIQLNFTRALHSSEGTHSTLPHLFSCLRLIKWIF